MNLTNFGFYYGPMPGNGWDGSNGWVGLIWGLLMFVIFIAIIILVVRTVGRGHYGHHYHDDHHAGAHRDPLDIARERYAKGDITKEQLAEIKKELKS